MRVKLGQIADVRTGYTIRTEFDWKSHGDRILVQMSDFGPLRRGCFDRLKTTNMKIRKEWILEEEDLLIKARGSDFVPVVVPKSFHGAVYAHPLLRIRIDQRQAHPEFMAWLLSQSHIQTQLNRMTTGTSMLMLNLDHLKSLELNLPSLDRQRKICEVARLADYEQSLTKLLQKKRTQHVNYILDKLTTEESIEPPLTKRL